MNDSQVIPLREKKPTLLDLWMSYRFDLPSLATEAGVTASTANDIIGSLPVSRDDAEKILAALSATLHKDLTLETVHVVLRMPVNQSEVARMRALIEAENEAGRRALYDLASGVSQHQIMTAKAERQAEQFDELRKTLGDDVAQYMVFGEWRPKTEGTSTNAT